MKNEGNLEELGRELKALQCELSRLEAKPGHPSRKLLLLVLKKDLQDLVHQMRRQQREIRQKMSKTTRANQAANAYSNSIHLSKNHKS